MTILLLEPDKAHAEKCQGILSELPEDVEVIITSYPEDAMQLIEDKEISVLISEFDIGVMSAEELFSMMSLSSPKTVLMLMTEVTDTEHVLNMYNHAMFFELILKPLNFPEELLDPLYRAMSEYEKRCEATYDVKDHEISAKRYITDYDTLKKELQKRIKDYSFIYQIFSGMIEGNIAEYGKLHSLKDIDTLHIKAFAQGLIAEYIRVFIFGDKNYEGYMARISELFDNKTTGSKVTIENHATSELSDSQVKSFYFFVYLCAYLSKNMFSIYKINATIDEKEDTYVYRAANDLEISKINGELIYIEDNKHVRDMYHTITDTLLKTVFLKTMKGYEENPYFMLVMLGKDS
jgi:hypothetical protein